MKKLKEFDFVTFFAKKLKNDNTLYEQQKVLIESQMKSSKEFFKNNFNGKNFKKEARDYLKAVGKIQ